MWSIGIYSGESPFRLNSHAGVENPVLTCEDVLDVQARFVADPFMVSMSGLWYMFFETLNDQTNKGEIGLATSEDGLEWTYQKIVLAEPFHLSYPYVFEWRGEHYMVPETLEANGVCLYKADSFPEHWSCLCRLLEGSYADPSVFPFDDKWWLFACSTPYRHDTLRLYVADELSGPWREHPKSPIVEGDKTRARPAGRIVSLENKIVRFAQNCGPRYGAEVRAFKISELTSTSYREAENEKSPILTASGTGWNGSGMHHVDPHRGPDGGWIACVDGFSDAGNSSTRR